MNSYHYGQRTFGRELFPVLLHSWPALIPVLLLVGKKKYSQFSQNQSNERVSDSVMAQEMICQYLQIIQSFIHCVSFPIQENNIAQHGKIVRSSIIILCF